MTESGRSQDDSAPESSGPGGSNRRDLLKWAARGFLSLWGAAVAWIVVSFVRPPRSGHSFAERVLRVGSVDELAVGQARLVHHGREPIFVVRVDEDRLVALAAVCTHLHCILRFDRDSGAFACPCHDGAFDLSGNVLKGPPPRALNRYRVEIRLGEIYVHV